MDKPSQDLIEKYFNGTASESEARLIFDWFETEEGQQYLDGRFEKDARIQKKPANKSFDPADSIRILNSIKSNLPNINQRTSAIIYRPQSHNSFRLVAACIILLFAVIYVMKFHTVSGNYTGFELFETGALEQKIVNLIDGTTVRLSENSRLQIPDDFNSRSRSVKLDGQAYFEVVNSPELEFEVYTCGIKIGVLGTAFNVNTLTISNSVVVAVSKGKVSVELGPESEKNKEILTENMVGFFNYSSRLVQKENSDIHNYLSWIHGNIMFDETPFLNVLGQLDRIYGFTNVIEDDELIEFRLTANFTRGSFNNVLETIAEGLDIKYRFENGTIYWINNNNNKAM